MSTYDPIALGVTVGLDAIRADAEQAAPERRDRCGNEPWPCYHPLCSNDECTAHRRRFPNCKGYSCSCRSASLTQDGAE